MFAVLILSSPGTGPAFAHSRLQRAEPRADSTLKRPPAEVKLTFSERLEPKTLGAFRGKKIVLLVFYDLPGSRERLTEIAKRYGALSVQGVEVVAVAARGAADAIADLGQSPPVLFEVVTEGNADIAATYRQFARSSTHAEFLIDRSGYARAIWRNDTTGIPDADTVQAQVERLNAEKTPPPLDDYHIH